MAAAMVGVGLLPQISRASGNDSPRQSENRASERKSRAEARRAELSQREVSRAAKQMRRAAASVKSQTHDLLDGIENDPAAPDLRSMTDEELSVFVDGVLAQIDAIVNDAQATIQELHDASAAKLQGKNAPPGAKKRLGQAKDSSAAFAERMGERAAEKLDRLVAELLAAGSDDSDDEVDDAGDDSSEGGSGNGDDPAARD